MDARNIGLRNIEVADTKISSIDGENGKLIYRGYDILDLVNHSTFEETAYLLLYGELPDKIQLDEFSYKLKQSRKLPISLIANLENRPKTARPMDVLQSAVPSLADFELRGGRYLKFWQCAGMNTPDAYASNLISEAFDCM